MISVFFTRVNKTAKVNTKSIIDSLQYLQRGYFPVLPFLIFFFIWWGHSPALGEPTSIRGWGRGRCGRCELTPAYLRIYYLVHQTHFNGRAHLQCFTFLCAIYQSKQPRVFRRSTSPSFRLIHKHVYSACQPSRLDDIAMVEHLKQVEVSGIKWIFTSNFTHTHTYIYIYILVIYNINCSTQVVDYVDICKYVVNVFVALLSDFGLINCFT